MKLKEKLANEYNGSLLMKFVSTTTNQEAYIAGFDKCSALIIQACKDSDSDQWDESMMESVGEQGVENES